METPSNVLRIVMIAPELLTMHEHVQSILQAPIMKANNGRELHIKAIKLLDHYNMETFLTILR